MEGCERGSVGVEVVGCAVAAAPAPTAGVGGGGGGEKVRVLVVDDSPVDRKIVERLLRRSGSAFEGFLLGNLSLRILRYVIGCGHCSFAASLCAMLKKNAFFLFSVMAVDGGKKALEALGLNEVDDDSCAVNEHKLRRSIPVVIMSSENDSQRISSCLAIGAEDFILKPLTAVDIKHLRNYVRPPSPSGPLSPSANKAGSKRKLSVEVVTENNEPDRRPRPRLTGVAVA
ncbi:hypothetical protein Taro_008667 [Colocasia esculenta]|uniref:Uncharacterized protein n=1 Tax=Colocasia esculenta TaxID=4460 RepID=A0A843U3N3_COLES|nr:hypothetical protein [Colocasia esculenta]